MKSWQQMKDLSYVTIKRTKAKSLSQGLNKSRIDKFTRQNPIYQHLQFHKLLQKKNHKQCVICSKHKLNNSMLTQQSTPKSFSLPLKKCNSLNNDILSKKKSQQNSLRSKYIQRAFFHQQRLSPRQYQYKVVTQSLKQFSNIVKKFNKSLKISRTNLQKMTKNNKIMSNYFKTECIAIDQQINQDKGVDVYQTNEEEKMIKQQIQQNKKRILQRKLIVAKMNTPVKFPLKDQQSKEIIDYQTKNINKQKKKILQLLSNVYQYKSNLNYKNRIKIINQCNK